MINQLYLGDNLEILKKIPKDYVDLIYLDPPFNTGRDFKDFKDKFKSLEAFIDFLNLRIIECHRVLKKTGVFCLHLDYRSVHYLKIELDKIFGEKNFLNEVVWHYGERQSPHIKHYNRKHDTLLFYSKSKNYKFEMQFKPYSESYIKAFFNKEDKKGKYTSCDGGKGKPRYKRYLKDAKGIAMDSVWNDIKMLGNISQKKERLGYPTQKPLALLDRIINTFTNKNDLILDPFCGSGTTCVSAKNLKRNYIGIDINPKAVEIANKRLKLINN